MMKQKTKQPTIVFMGTPDFAVPTLRRLLDEGYHIAAVVTQPDRPKGRKKVLTPPPVKEEALRHGLPVLQPEKIKDEAALEQLEQLAPDLIITAAYGQILPERLLNMPKHGCINVHASLLPKYRGAAPIHYAVMNGEKETGVTLMYMEKGLDTGDMISKVKVPIEETDNTGTLFEKLSQKGAELVIQTLPDLLAGKIQAIPQNDDEATYAPMLTRDDERIDWSRTSRQIFNQVRGLNPWPGAFTTWEGKVLKIWECEVHDEAGAPSDQAFKPGEVIGLTAAELTVKTGDGAVKLKRVQPAGKRAMDIKEFIPGSRMAIGMMLGEQVQ